jgi:hypothetical protein
MKNHRFLWLILIFIGAIIYASYFHIARAQPIDKYQRTILSAMDQQAAQAPAPTDVSPVAAGETPEDRVLPPVGSNAGLVIGASVLVLIIIGGVLGSRLKAKH